MCYNRLWRYEQAPRALPEIWCSLKQVKLNVLKKIKEKLPQFLTASYAFMNPLAESAP